MPNTPGAIPVVVIVTRAIVFDMAALIAGSGQYVIRPWLDS